MPEWLVCLSGTVIASGLTRSQAKEFARRVPGARAEKELAHYAW
jgi:hypothetical protein